ncbi:MAG: hypothetical protein GY841_07400 [FCB group bacterium]|nr:hypothetical protein [FCB group bacterium]
MLRKLTAQQAATRLAEIHKIPICEDCDVLRGANIYARKRYGMKYAGLFENNLKSIITTHVDLGCQPCPVDELMHSFRRDRLASLAAML